MIEALYLHVPFCFHKCHYCDFYSLAQTPDPDAQEAFVVRVLEELTHRRQHLDLRPRTIFVGGGTPTLLGPAAWRHLLNSMTDLDLLREVVEFTVEANPETVTDELARTLAAGGVNRMSLGAQSFHRPLLKTLERWHEPENVARAVGVLREAGIDNLNLDLIFAIPGQTLASLRADLEAAIGLQPMHLSCYGLTYEPQTAMTQRLKLGQVTAIEEDVERAMYEMVLDHLGGAGFEQYEVSNWARTSGSESRRCLHNLAYWTNRNWLGIGPSAASHVDGYRWKNQPSISRYMEQSPEPPTMDHEHLPPERRVGEELMLRLRLREGVPLTWLAEHLAADYPRHAVIAELISIEMLQRTQTHLRLTRRGLLVADAVIAKLL